ncbi:oxidoreductase [Mycobacterium sp. IS-1590]|uniref:mannitol dehydrogenase family protein n=1 Tax=Mycobacterium sp. IS-1590 TaxID=1772286 RepID=UPI000747ADE1|nr:mannitol dehydrogenase family protein [Mycobacterium sp. IS-1590]KUI45287.1 oxidoreductase [Mycobacterium sp. IS-1590]
MTDVGHLLYRRDGDLPARPVRIAHLGTGNFFRAHQAWYTEHAGDGADWGIAAFAGRSGATARQLAAQDGLYTLLVRGADGDRPEIISSLTSVSADLDDWRRCFALPELALATLTVTEAGYRRAGDGSLDRADAEVVADIDALRHHGTAAEVVTAPGKFVLGFAVRRGLGLPGLAVVPCDNVPDNGAMAERVVADLAEAVDPGLAEWIAAHIAYVSTVVDRITPRPTDDDRAAAHDPAAVVTEPYSEWVLCGEFPQGRPRWEAAGARIVADIAPWEARKLWLLNGSHSLMAYAATLRGHHTVDEAVSDPVVLGWVQQWWDDAARQLPLPDAEIASYRAALLERYANPRIRHRLSQIAADGSQKLPIRVLPTVRGELAAGRVPVGAARILAAWVCHLRGQGAPVNDIAAEEFTALAAAAGIDEAVDRVLARLGVDDDRLRDAVATLARELSL